MSGGSYDYAYGRITDMADQLRLTTPLRKVFQDHLRKVSKACHDIEWVDSGDSSPGEEDAAIRECIGANTSALVLVVAIDEAKNAQRNLEQALMLVEDI